MLKDIIFLIFIILITSPAFSQQGVIKGTVTDKNTGETLINANVLFGEGKGVTTDMDGNFSIEVPNGEYSLTISYIGFKTNSRKVTVNDNIVTVNFALEGITLSEVQVVADVARTRETPVAFSTIPVLKIQEELASRDIPMILNATPGVYATQSGGGDGDARITIRGFSQRNVAVMLDGIPVNDMENGWVYWSNWFGLDMVMRSTQVQRGLGASKLANPSVGGTLNIISQGIEAKKGGRVKQELGNDGFMRTSVGLTSGQLSNGFGITAAGSYKQGNGWVDQTWTKGWFYFLKIEKKLEKHLLSASAMGAPQKHAQRSYKKSIAYFDAEYADKIGITDSLKYSEIKGYGTRFNPHWGYIRRYKAPNGDTIPANVEILHEKVNYYHKPQFTLKDFWTVNDKFYISNIAYLSVGSGGGTGLNASGPPVDVHGQIDFQSIYEKNTGPYSILPLIDSTEHQSFNYLNSSVNNHFWYGLLSTINYSPGNHVSVSGGVDMRDYVGSHYRTVYDLIGGDYAIENSNLNQESNVKRTGDRIGYYNDGLVRWAGSFAQAEIKGGFWTAFINISGAYSGYKRIDYFRKKELLVGDTLLNIGYRDTIIYDGAYYTRDAAGLRFAQTGWKWIPGFTVKTGANFNLTEFQNVFFNVGYLSKTPRFNNVIDRNNKFFTDIKNEIVKSAELGYNFQHEKFAVNLNGYYTIWENKPADRAGVYTDPDGNIYSVNINGMDALHQGVEFDFIYKAFSNLELEGLVSYGDWVWTSKDTARKYDDNGNLVYKQSFDAKGVHVGDAAQMQSGASIRYEVIKGLYIKTQGTYFGKNFAEFDPLSLDGINAGRESWQMPDDYLLDLHAGYNFKIGKIKMDLRASVLNLLNEVYVSDAQNNDSFLNNYNDFDAKSAGVFFGLGRRFNTSLQITF
ncbi:MAG: TonB-dependent receptor [Bacteroidetes bacterium]|nr:TonB-dependent receptor [Bacteroidota bacterium]